MATKQQTPSAPNEQPQLSVPTAAQAARAELNKNPPSQQTVAAIVQQLADNVTGTGITIPTAGEAAKNNPPPSNKPETIDKPENSDAQQKPDALKKPEATKPAEKAATKSVVEKIVIRCGICQNTNTRPAQLTDKGIDGDKTRLAGEDKISRHTWRRYWCNDCAKLVKVSEPLKK